MKAKVLKMGNIPALSENPKYRPHIEYLNEKDFQTFMNYKHKAPKTLYENWFLDNVAGPMEKQIWRDLNPNAITWIGNVALVIASCLCIYEGGLKYHDTPPLTPTIFWFCSFSTMWFSFWDAFDGQRARRLICGTPVGRIIDQAGDTMQYTMFALIMGYVVKLPPGWLTLCYGLVNFPGFIMEIEYIITGNFNNCDDYFGPIELEMIIAFIYFCAGLFGVEWLHLHPGFGPEWLLWVHCLLVLFVAFIFYASYE